MFLAKSYLDLCFLLNTFLPEALKVNAMAWPDCGRLLLELASCCVCLFVSTSHSICLGIKDKVHKGSTKKRGVKTTSYVRVFVLVQHAVYFAVVSSFSPKEKTY